jgi:hypothetical protein
MKTRIFNLACLAVFLLLTSCGKDDNGGNMGGGNDNAPITLECSHSTDITLTNQNPDGIDYIVDCNLEVGGGLFKIESGTTIQFNEGASLTVDRDGIFRALGSSGSPITLIGTDQGRASWRGIFINTSAGANQLEHVIIEDAGDGEVFGQFTDNHAAVTFQGRLSMRNCTIINSGDIGVFSEENLDESQIDMFDNITISGCKRFPILINQNHISSMDLNSCTFTENGINMVGLHQDHGDRLNLPTTFEALDIPYFIESGIDLYASLTLESGVDIVMGNGAFINSTTNNNQYILIQGSQSNHVTIRGQEALSGFWQGIYITEPNAQNIWEYLDLSDGGSKVQGFNSTPANVTLEMDANLVINNCTSSRSGSACDIVVSTFSGTPILENNSSEIVSVCSE